MEFPHLQTLPARPKVGKGFKPQSVSALIGETAYAVSYSGFRSGQHPDRGTGAVYPSRAEIREDLQLLEEAGLTVLRLYDSKQNTRDVLEVIREDGLPHRVMLGVWLDAEKSNHMTCPWLHGPIPEATLEANRVANQAELKTGIDLANEFQDIVIAMNVGNETLVDWNDHGVRPETLRTYLIRARQAIQQPVTTAENYVAWVDFAAALSGSVDFIGVHTYPAWEQKTVEEALAHSVQNLVDVQKAYPNTPIAIVEAGWASEATEFASQANEANQIRHYDELMGWAVANNVTTFWFEAFDEDWKGAAGNPGGAEKHWGLWNVDRTPKAAVSNGRLPLKR